jgi:hypothetical protein
MQRVFWTHRERVESSEDVGELRVLQAAVRERLEARGTKGVASKRLLAVYRMIPELLVQLCAHKRG